MKNGLRTLIHCSIVLLVWTPSIAEKDLLLENFRNPPKEAKARNWWHWPNNYATKEGITKDLEWMANSNMGGATIFSLGRNHVFKSGSLNETLIYGSLQWVDMMRHAAAEAERLNLVIGMNNCDGWATAGGPWITPENSMKELTYTTTRVKGRDSFQGKLPVPIHKLDFYEDVAILAYPATRPATLAFSKRKIETKWKGIKKLKNVDALFDQNLLSETRLMMPKNGKIGPLEITFDKPIQLSGIVLHPSYPAIQKKTKLGNAILDIKQTDGSWKQLTQIQLEETPSGAIFETVTAHALRLTAQHNPPKPWMRWLSLAEIELLAPGETSPLVPLVNDIEAKSGSALRMRRFMSTQKIEEHLLTPKNTIIDLTHSIDSDGSLNWQAPSDNDWIILRIGLTTTGKENGPGTKAGTGLEVDKLDRRGIDAHWTLFLSPLLDQLEPYTGDSFGHLLIDSWEAGPQNWTESFPQEFKKRRGYDLIPFLPIISGEIIESLEVSEEALNDWRLTIAELITENFYGAFNELCQSRGIILEAEAAGSQGGTSDPIANSAAVDRPMSEFWVQRNLEKTHLYQIKRGQLESVAAARLYGKPIVAAEAFTSSAGNWIHDPALLKPHADGAFAVGMNLLYHHTSMHQPDDSVPGWSMNPWGININRKVTWADQADAWGSYLARCQAMLQGYETVSDVLLLIYPDMPAYFEIDKFDRDFRDLPFNGYSPTIINESTLAKLNVEDGKIIAPSGHFFHILDDGGHGNRSDYVAQQLDRLGRHGANVGNGAKLAQKLSLQKDFEYTAKEGKAVVPFIHKRNASDDWYFLSNQEDQAIEIDAIFRVAGRTVELWYPDTGKIEAVTNLEVKSGRTHLPLVLDPYGSVFVVFRETATPGIPEQKKSQVALVRTIDKAWNLKIDGHTHQLTQLISWTELPEESGRFFSGTAVYESEFEINDITKESKAIHIDLGEVANIADVTINSKDLGTYWKAPYKVDVTNAVRTGINKLVIKVTNFWPNRLIGDAKLPQSERTTWTNNDTLWDAKSELLPSGLLGPIELIVHDK